MEIPEAAAFGVGPPPSGPWRWRPFSDPSTISPPEFRGGGGLPVPSELGWFERKGFPEAHSVHSFPWEVERLGRFKYDEHITAKDARVAIWSLSFDLADNNNHSKRLGRLVDNFAVALALNKGRTHTHCLLQQTPKLCALT